ncbi:MAG: hypothetical protein HYY42_01170 [Chloroflexi bacterium]|nr:hypothetical protein [Chloroflexota bacterium]MBI2982796.1 hypothetical protein [Chloroflexota bacterium]
MNGLLRALKRKDDEPAVETLDVDTLKSRIGEPLPPKTPAPEPAEYVRTDSRSKEERSWRKVAGLPR